MSTKSTILVVDDQPEHLQAIRKILNDSDDEYEILVASNGEIACNIAKKELPDLIVMDWDMPLMNGIEATKCICAGKETRDIPIIIMTGVMMSAADMKTAFEAGATEYLRKPVENVELITRVRSMLKLSQKFKEVKSREAELEKQNLELKEKNEELDAFNHTVAHDLRNPLTLILGYVGIIKTNIAAKCSKKEKEFIDRTLEITANMAKIIEALLLFASVRRAEEIPLETTDNDSIIKNVLKLNEVIINKKTPNIKMHEPIQKAIGYGPWIEAVWSNLIYNAVKYGGDPLEIEIGSDPVNGFVRFWIKNNGECISEEQQKTIFNQFTRANIDNIEGHGLGLSIVSRIIKKLSGEVGVESSQEKGTTFYFTLPVEV